MCRLNSFLFFKLDWCGKLVAFIGMTIYGILILLTGALLLKLLLMPCNDIAEQFKILDTLLHTSPKSLVATSCNSFKLLSVLGVLTVFLVFFGFFYMHYALLEGIRERRCSQIAPMIISKSCDVIVGLLFFFVFNTKHSYYYISFFNFMHICIFLVLILIKIKIKEENMAVSYFRYPKSSGLILCA
ncbi:unnamed protein product [Chironomus riparius]|uniref:Uncharacterized protein n=1 Tax=Chironomus riparius TaxID=315576 RepID=A0A9N9WW50_9DIPT|nr:unnamed protein product [Chironomus riparius]